MAALSDLLGAKPRFEFTAVDQSAIHFDVVNLHGREAISGLFRFELTLVSPHADIDLSAMLKTQVSLRIFSADHLSSAPYHGILAEFEQLHQAGGHYFYRAVLVPRLWRLSQYAVSDLYLENLKTPDLIKSVLDKANHKNYIFATSAVYDPRDYVSQVEESYLNFLSRWMERDGLYYYFAHGESEETLHIVDKLIGHDGATADVDYRPADKLDTGIGNRSVHTFIGSARALPRRVVVQDYNYQSAAAPLEGIAEVSADGIGDIMLQGENFRTADEGNRYAALRAEALKCTGQVFVGESTVVGLRSGSFMRLGQHFRASFNGRYLITEIEHRGSQAGALLNGLDTPYNDNNEGPVTYYSNSFQAIPDTVQFRSQRVTPWPRRTGTISAVIDSSGSYEYADLDDKGRYLVQMRFNLTPRAAGANKVRIRMASPYAGMGKGKDKDLSYGMHMPLHKGAEVLLSFEGGDPDRPVILGAVTNSSNPNVVKAESDSYPARLITGGNRILIEDKKGAEAITLSSDGGNSTTIIGTGSTKGIWQSTSGSSVSLAVGDTTSVSVGVKNSFSASIENSMSASIATKASLGSSIGVSYGRDVSWKFGKSITLDEAEAVSLKTDGKLQANTTVTLSGGQRKPIKETLDKLITVLKNVVKANVAVNMLSGAGAAAAIGVWTDKAGGKAGPWDSAAGGVHAAQALVNTLGTSYAHHVALEAAADALKTASVGVAYSSNIVLGNESISLKADGLVPLGSGSIDIGNGSVKMEAKSALPLGSSKMEMSSTKVRIVGNGVAALSSSMELTGTGATMGTLNPAGTVTVKTPTTSVELAATTAKLKTATTSVALDPASAKLTTPTTSLELAAAAATLALTGGGKLVANASGLVGTANASGTSKLTIAPATAQLDCGSARVGATAVGVVIKGPIIRLA